MSRPALLGGAGRLAALPALLALLSCAGGNLASKLAEAPAFEPPGGATKCGVAKSQAAPLIVEWPDADRGKLESLVKKHLVAVRYVGCDMQVLDQCTVPGKYGYSAVTRKKTRVRMRDADDLYANIPVHAAKFEAALQKAGELNVAMIIVGRYEADAATGVRPEALHGECAGATHVLSAMTVGAFEFFAGADATVGGEATVAGLGAHAKSASQRETLNEDGDKALCEKSSSTDARAPEGCGALLRVEVVPLGEAKRAESAPAAAAAGRAAATVSPGPTFVRAGLVWQWDPPKRPVMLEAAKAYCAGLSLDGGGWRLPSKGELDALFAQKLPADEDTIPGMGEVFYWSSTQAPEAKAWTVRMSEGKADAMNPDGPFPSSVRCVR